MISFWSTTCPQMGLFVVSYSFLTFQLSISLLLIFSLFYSILLPLCTTDPGFFLLFNMLLNTANTQMTTFTAVERPNRASGSLRVFPIPWKKNTFQTILSEKERLRHIHNFLQVHFILLCVWQWWNAPMQQKAISAAS